MKKFLGILLSIALVLGLASCGETTASVQTETTVSSVSSASASETVSESQSESKSESESKSKSESKPESEPESEPDSAPADNPAEGTDTETSSENSSASADDQSWTFTDMDTVKYARTSINVRDLPCLEGEKLGSLKKNERVHITGRCNETGWYRFEYKNGIAYGHGSYFVNEKIEEQVKIEEKNDNVADVPQANNSGNSTGSGSSQSGSGSSQSGGSVTGYPNEDFTDVEPAYSYPDPATVSLDVTPITKNNYTTYVTGNRPADLDDYKADTVFGFVVEPTGLNSNLHIFDRIDFYVYDAKYYATTMKPISDTLRSANPPSGTTLSFISNEGQTDDNGKTYFYPYNDTHYVAKVSIDLKRSGDGELLNNPRAVFLFSDFTGDTASCESNLQTRTSGLAGTGYTVSAAVNDAFANGEFFRGRDYEVTFRLHVDSNEVTEATNRMYPEVLGRMRSCILKASATSTAPYEAPTYFFYPADSDSSSLTYGYYVQAKDGDKIFSNVNMATTAGTVQTNTKVNPSWFSAPVTPNVDAQVKVDSLSKNSQVSVTFVENRYVASYNRGTTVTAFKRFFTSANDLPTGSFGVSTDSTLQRVNFNITFTTSEMARNVAAVKGAFNAENGTPITVRLKSISVSGNIVQGYVEYSDLASINQGGNITVLLIIYYDSGIEGLRPTAASYGSDLDTAKFVCIREAGETGAGPYILPDETTGSGFINSQSVNAAGSIFRATRPDTGAGAQLQDIAGTLSNTPGKVCFEFYDMGGAGLFHYETDPDSVTGLGNTVTGLGGMYDASITANQHSYTISLISSTNNIKGPDLTSTTAVFQIGNNVP